MFFCPNLWSCMDRLGRVEYDQNLLNFSLFYSCRASKKAIKMPQILSKLQYPIWIKFENRDHFIVKKSILKKCLYEPYKLTLVTFQLVRSEPIFLKMYPVTWFSAWAFRKKLYQKIKKNIRFSLSRTLTYILHQYYKLAKIREIHKALHLEDNYYIEIFPFDFWSTLFFFWSSKQRGSNKSQWTYLALLF